MTRTPEPFSNRRASRIPTVRIAGVDFHALSETQCAAHIVSELRNGRGGWIVTANLDHLRRAQDEKNYGALIRDADIVVADGMPIVWAAALQGTPLPGRVAGSDLVSSIAREASLAGQSLFLLGGNPGTAEAAGDVLAGRFPGLEIAGCLCPEPGFEQRPAELRAISAALCEARPDVVYVALGSPKQEILIRQSRELLPSAWWIGVGISFSYLSGRLKRPPAWFRNLGGEWLLRLVQEPRRMSERYLLRGIPFGLMLLGGALAKRWRPRPGSGALDDGPDRDG